MQAGVKYTPAFPMDDYATVTKNIAKIDALLTNALKTANATSIKDTVKSEIDEALKETGITKNSQPGQPGTVSKRYVRTKNYRTVRNAEGMLEVIIDASNATDCGTELEKITADSIIDVGTDPIEKTLETPASPVTVEVVMDGIPVSKTENKAVTPKAVTTHNAAAPLTSNHPDLQPFLASNADLQAMLALAKFSEIPANVEMLTKTDANTYNAAVEENADYMFYGDNAPLEMPTLFPAK
jgi:hypothetical protein